MIDSSAPCAVEWCDRPVGDGYVCQHCADRLARDLGDIAALWDELDTVLAKQSRYSQPEGRGGEKALPFNPTASEIGWVLRNTITTWCRLVIEERPVITGPVHPACLHISCNAARMSRWPADNVPACSAYLLGHVTWLRHHRAGHEAVEEITSVVHAVRRVIDRPAERVYAGPCANCGEDVYGKIGDTSVECRPCGISYDVAEVQAQMREAAYGRLVTAREGVTLLGLLGHQVAQKTIEKWHQRKRLAEHGHDPDGTRLYLFDDLANLAALAAVNTPDERSA